MDIVIFFSKHASKELWIVTNVLIFRDILWRRQRFICILLQCKWTIKPNFDEVLLWLFYMYAIYVDICKEFLFFQMGCCVNHVFINVTRYRQLYSFLKGLCIDWTNFKNIYFETCSMLSTDKKPFVLCRLVFKFISFLMHNKYKY